MEHPHNNRIYCRGVDYGFELTARCEEMRAELLAFMDEYIYPNEETFEAQLDRQGTRWQTPQIVDDLKAEGARSRGLWNLFLPDAHHGAGLTNAEYAPLCEIMGRVDWAPEVFNCNAPDTGNMEVLHMYGTPAQQDAWLTPLLNGEIRSAFRHDRARRGLLGRDQRRMLDHPRRRRICRSTAASGGPPTRATRAARS